MDKILISISFAVVLIAVGLANLNPWTSPAQARRIDAETIYQMQLNEIAIQEKELELAAKAEQYNRDRIQDQEIHAQIMANNQRLADAVITMVIVLGSALSIGILIIAIAICTTVIQKVMAAPSRPHRSPKPTNGNSMRVRIVSVRQPYEPWGSPQYQKSIIEQACDNERFLQNDPIVDGRLQSACGLPRSTRIVGKERYYSMPQAD